jgi:hypothetical protein
MNGFKKIGFLCSLLFVFSQLDAAELEDFSVLILGPMDGRVVLKLPGGKMQVVSNGQILPGTRATVKQILNDRLVVEDVQDGDPPSVQTVWLYKAASPREKSRIKRLTRTLPPQTPPKLNFVKKIEE